MYYYSKKSMWPTTTFTYIMWLSLNKMLDSPALHRYTYMNIYIFDADDDLDRLYNVLVYYHHYGCFIFYILAITKEPLYNCNRLFDLSGFVILI